jgi:hypothetical protein
LQLHDLTALPLHLHKHALDFGTDELDVWHPSILFPAQTDSEQRLYF